ncbi:MAG TPA: HlyD family efflux transporter periplasmic adaptor subunit, partial [Vicinamibacteria bacterium]
VIDPSRLQVTVAVPVRDLGRIVVGRAARIKPSGSAAEGWEGQVLGLPATVDPATGTAAVRVSAPAGLAAGTPVQLEILAEEHQAVIVVPAAAVVRENDQAAVFVVGADGKAHRRLVTLGIEAGDEVEIQQGVAEGEPVVVEGHDELPDGATVTTEPAQP